MWRRRIQRIASLVGTLIITEASLLATDHQMSGPDPLRPQPFKLEAKVIERVADVHPRFAATLANQNEFGFHRGVFTIHWTPIPLRKSDIQAFLDRRQHRDYFAKYNERAKSINKWVEAGSISVILYKMEVASRGFRTVNIDLTILKGSRLDPPGEGLAMTISDVEPDTAFVATLNNTTWSIKRGRNQLSKKRGLVVDRDAADSLELRTD